MLLIQRTLFILVPLSNAGHTPNHTDSIVNCLRQAGQLRHDEKTYASKFKAPYQTFGTVTTPATETESIGLPANAQSVMVFAVLPIQITYDETTPALLPGLAKTTPSADLPAGRQGRQIPRQRLTTTATNHTICRSL